MPLTDAWLKANHEKECDARYEKTDREGLSVRVSIKGKITFQMRYRFPKGGKQQRLDLGSYPNMDLKSARRENTSLREELEKGFDPAVKKNLTYTENASLKVNELFYQWYKSYCEPQKVGAADIKRSFEIHLLPKVGKYPASQVPTAEWYQHLLEISKYRPGIAERILVNAKQMFSWGIRQKLLVDNPLTSISASKDLAIKKKVGLRSLTPDEIRLLFEALENSNINRKNRIFVELCLLYACRTGELRKAKISDFDFQTGVWTVPKENHKRGKYTQEPILRPIIGYAKELVLEAIKLSNSDIWLFTNRDDVEMMSRSAPLSFPKNLIKWVSRHLNITMSHWTIHDLRKTARTNFSQRLNNEALVAPHIAEIMLGHKLPGDWETYDHYKYLLEQAEAYKKWAGKLDELKQAPLPKPDAEVEEQDHKVW